ncbi:calphotin isoform X1 [Coregonus clupeaformis]|uniref:calphotin isoform X1 n=1 Tax=Coregonus clupeaformis TaxID=59861 RepID=UPI001BE0D2B7|nr:calphotin isoform X1 [Coregonus clupeaformis]XP_041710817.1 calphotin isoform X1 [Coregonus clupeaformis]XP_041710818.1 calphotin isoform X1 [Coregonus clupeaformis]XP_045064966.1 calphotin isoform X1 [Coregonus clupeaformis]
MVQVREVMGSWAAPGLGSFSSEVVVFSLLFLLLSIILALCTNCRRHSFELRDGGEEVDRTQSQLVRVVRAGTGNNNDDSYVLTRVTLGMGVGAQKSVKLEDALAARENPMINDIRKDERDFSPRPEDSVIGVPEQPPAEQYGTRLKPWRSHREAPDQGDSSGALEIANGSPVAMTIRSPSPPTTVDIGDLSDVLNFTPELHSIPAPIAMVEVDTPLESVSPPVYSEDTLDATIVSSLKPVEATIVDVSIMSSLEPVDVPILEPLDVPIVSSLEPVEDPIVDVHIMSSLELVEAPLVDLPIMDVPIVNSLEPVDAPIVSSLEPVEAPIVEVPIVSSLEPVEDPIVDVLIMSSLELVEAPLVDLPIMDVPIVNSLEPLQAPIVDAPIVSSLELVEPVDASIVSSLEPVEHADATVINYLDILNAPVGLETLDAPVMNSLDTLVLDAFIVNSLELLDIPVINDLDTPDTPIVNILDTLELDAPIIDVPIVDAPIVDCLEPVDVAIVDSLAPVDVLIMNDIDLLNVPVMNDLDLLEAPAEFSSSFIPQLEVEGHVEGEDQNHGPSLCVRPQHTYEIIGELTPDELSVEVDLATPGYQTIAELVHESTTQPDDDTTTVTEPADQAMRP